MRWPKPESTKASSEYPHRSKGIHSDRQHNRQYGGLDESPHFCVGQRHVDISRVRVGISTEMYQQKPGCQNTRANASEHKPMYVLDVLERPRTSANCDEEWLVGPPGLEPGT
jgi:hypothetical protein